MNALSAALDGLQDRILRGDGAIFARVRGADAGQRLRIYADAYRLRLAEVLGNDFPATREALGEDAYEDYNRQRREWHANLGPIRTPQLADLHEDLWDIVDSNLQDGDKAKGAVAIDAFPGLGKTTAVLDFAKKFHRRECKEQGTLQNRSTGPRHGQFSRSSYSWFSHTTGRPSSDFMATRSISRMPRHGSHAPGNAPGRRGDAGTVPGTPWPSTSRCPGWPPNARRPRSRN